MKSILENTRRPDVTFHRNGRIDIASRVSKVLSLCCGDVIDIGQEGDEWYIYKKYDGHSLTGNHKAQCRHTNSGKRFSHTMRCYSRRLCEVMFRLAGEDSDVLRVPVGEKTLTEGGRIAMPVIYRYNIKRP